MPDSSSMIPATYNDPLSGQCHSQHAKGASPVTVSVSDAKTSYTAHNLSMRHVWHGLWLARPLWKLPESWAIAAAVVVCGIGLPSAPFFTAASISGAFAFAFASGLLVLVFLVIPILLAIGYRQRSWWRKHVQVTGSVAGLLAQESLRGNFLFVGEPAELFQLLASQPRARRWRAWLATERAVFFVWLATLLWPLSNALSAWHDGVPYLLALFTIWIAGGLASVLPARAIRITPDGVLLRYGSRWSRKRAQDQFIPRDAIAHIVVYASASGGAVVDFWRVIISLRDGGGPVTFHLRDYPRPGEIVRGLMNVAGVEISASRVEKPTEQLASTDDRTAPAVTTE